MALLIPTRDDRAASQVRDAIRIIAWQQFKIDNKGKELEEGQTLYRLFDVEWQAEKCQKMTYTELVKFAKDLGYTLDQLSKIRSVYYENRDHNKANWETNNRASAIPEVMPDDMPGF
jgi:hypothetical protein